MQLAKTVKLPSQLLILIRARPTRRQRKRLKNQTLIHIPRRHIRVTNRRNLHKDLIDIAAISHRARHERVIKRKGAIIGARARGVLETRDEGAGWEGGIVGCSETECAGGGDVDGLAGGDFDVLGRR